MGIIFVKPTLIGYCAAILVVVPTPSRSHQSAFRPLWEELSLRGHKVTLLTTDPERNASLVNLIEIDLGPSYGLFERRGVWAHLVEAKKSFRDLGRMFGDALFELQEFQMTMPEVRRLLSDPHTRFDLLIVEALTPFTLSYSWRFRCPSIVFSSLEAPMTYRDSVGDVIHPSLEPDFNVDLPDDVAQLGLRDRLVSTLYAALYRYVVVKGLRRHEEQARKFFGEELPGFEGMMRNVSILLRNTHPLTHRPRTSAPNSIEVGGGMHIRPPKPLPEEMRSFLDASQKSRTVYFAFGGNIKGSILPEGFAESVQRVFSELPYKFILKTDETIRNVPENVLVTKWAPQQDILRHPAVGLFVTHGGLQSIQETLHSGVPILGIPFYGDAFANVNRAVRLGYGRRLKPAEFSEERLRDEIVEMMENSSYMLRAKELSEMYKYEDVASLKKAVHWVEHVLRFGHAEHLRSGLSEAPFWKFFMIDIVAMGVATLLATLLTIFCASKVFWNGICRGKWFYRKLHAE